MNTTPEATDRRSRGRPPLPEGKAKKILAGFKLSETENTAIERASKRAKMDKSSWMRTVLLEAAQAA